MTFFYCSISCLCGFLSGLLTGLRIAKVLLINKGELPNED